MRYDAAALFFFVAIAGVSLPAAGQPDRPQREDRPGLRQPDRESMRERLQRRLEETRQLEQRLTAALDALDRGEEPPPIAEPGVPMRGEWQRGRPFEQEPPPVGELPPPATDEEVMAFLDSAVPPIARRLREVRDAEPWVVERTVRRLAGRVAEIRVAREHDPALADLMVAETRSGLLVADALREVHRAVLGGGDEGALPAASASLRGALEAQFDARIKRREHEIVSLSLRIEELRAELTRQHAERETFIDRAVEQAVERAKRMPARPDEPRGGRR
ncbi:MAG: hypothetical protein KIS87_02630 [Phycisphaeraceae bacterium]|nr:hypothetical protein [Phycisphaeraceae bacterium]